LPGETKENIPKGTGKDDLDEDKAAADRLAELDQQHNFDAEKREE